MEHFDGTHVRVPVGLAERLVVAAENHFARLGRDRPETIDSMVVVQDWLSDLEQARVGPNPSAEPGDLLVKLGRGEFWTFTIVGWRELVPVELVADEGRRQTVEFTQETADRDFLVGPSEAVRAGWVEGGEVGFTSRQVPTDEPHSVAYDMRFEPPPMRRFFGRSVVEDELDRLNRIVEENAETTDDALVVVLVEKGSIEAGEFPDWIKPVYVKPGTIGAPVVIKHPQI